MNTSQRPRFNRKPDNCFFVFLLPTINAERPARKLNAGAQKCVIHLVKKIPTVGPPAGRPEYTLT